MLVVKGGQKIYKTKSSRLFKLFYPVPVFFARYPEVFSKTTTFHDLGDKLIMETGWFVLNEAVLADMSFAYQKCLATFSNYYVRENGDLTNKNIFFNFLLMFNNRRQTEVLLANLRYVLVNVLGVRSKIDEIMESMSTLTQDVVQRHILTSIIENYNDFSESLIKNQLREPLKNRHLITNGEMHTLNDLTFFLYSPFIMTKAPYDQTMEQVRNLKGMMKVHEEYKIHLSDEDSNIFNVHEVFDKKDGGNVFDNDFCFNSKYCEKVGRRAADYFKANDKVNDIYSK